MAKTEQQIIEEYLKFQKEGSPLLAGEKDEIKKTKKKQTEKKAPEKKSNVTKDKIIKAVDKGRSKVNSKKDYNDDDSTGVTKESNPLRDQYRAAARTKLLSKLSGVDPENPLASITGKKQAPPDHQYDIMGRLNVDKRRAQYGIRKQFAMPLQPITGRPLGAKRGCFVTAKVKIGKNRKTKIL